MFQNRVSVRTLAFYWYLWKKHIVDIFLSIKSLENGESVDQSGHADFCLYYFGARKECVIGNMVYLSLNNDAEWIKNIGKMDRDEKPITFDSRECCSAFHQNTLPDANMNINCMELQMNWKVLEKYLEQGSGSEQVLYCSYDKGGNNKGKKSNKGKG
ncbi:hypothetical protein Tco_0600786 [Tanacetum coccineum]